MQKNNFPSLAMKKTWTECQILTSVAYSSQVIKNVSENSQHFRGYRSIENNDAVQDVAMEATREANEKN